VHKIQITIFQLGHNIIADKHALMAYQTSYLCKAVHTQLDVQKSYLTT